MGQLAVRLEWQTCLERRQGTRDGCNKAACQMAYEAWSKTSSTHLYESGQMMVQSFATKFEYQFWPNWKIAWQLLKREQIWVKILPYQTQLTRVERYMVVVSALQAMLFIQ